MWFYRVEHVAVLVLGFLLGAVLAMCVAPGDILLAVMAGIVLSYFAHEFLDQSLGGELFWLFTQARPKKPVGSDQAVSHR
jgi:hypothetical protein